jgi:hypothetical protein
MLARTAALKLAWVVSTRQMGVRVPVGVGVLVGVLVGVGVAVAAVQLGNLKLPMRVRQANVVVEA